MGRRTTKGYRACNAPECRRLVAPGRAVILDTRTGRPRRLRFCSDECRQHHLAASRGRVCLACGQRFIRKSAVSTETVCPSCLAAGPERRLSLTAKSMAHLPGSYVEVDVVCPWCQQVHRTRSHLTGVTADDVNEILAIDPSAARLVRKFHPECRREAKNIFSGMRSSARDRGAYCGEPGQPLVTLADVCRLHQTTCCELCEVELSKPIRGLAAASDTGESDHTTPIAIGGMHARFNLRRLCHDCNRSRPRDGTDVCAWYSQVSDHREFGDPAAAGFISVSKAA
ncbi:MAG: hypothetical protein JWL76_626 [Thermoleophilia bacterium]|nr:hypothetical protein [Thermoleophilia bacterium]